MTSPILRRCAKHGLLVLLAFLAAAPALAQRGAMVLPRNLGQLTARASDILRGTVVSARVEKHPEFANLDTVVVTLRVTETLKGGAAGTFTFRQYIWDIRDRWDAAGYRKGQDLLLLLNATTRYGFTSPVGIEQGRFRIEPDAKGGFTAMNGTANARLFDGLAGVAKQGSALTPAGEALIAKHRKGPIELGQLEDLIRAFDGAAR